MVLPRAAPQEAEARIWEAGVRFELYAPSKRPESEFASAEVRLVAIFWHLRRHGTPEDLLGRRITARLEGPCMYGGEGNHLRLEAPGPHQE